MWLEWHDEGVADGVILKWWVGASLCRVKERFGFYSDGNGEPWRVCEQGKAVF